jgi:hypothetical protein
VEGAERVDQDRTAAGKEDHPALGGTADGVLAGTSDHELVGVAENVAGYEGEAEEVAGVGDLAEAALVHGLAVSEGPRRGDRPLPAVLAGGGDREVGPGVLVEVARDRRRSRATG